MAEAVDDLVAEGLAVGNDAVVFLSREEAELDPSYAAAVRAWDAGDDRSAARDYVVIAAREAIQETEDDMLERD